MWLTALFRRYWCSKNVDSVFNTCSTRFEHSLNANISGMKLSITSNFSVRIMWYFGASDRPIKKLANSTFKSYLAFTLVLIRRNVKSLLGSNSLNIVFALKNIYNCCLSVKLQILNCIYLYHINTTWVTFVYDCTKTD